MWTKLFFAFALYFSSLGQPIFAGWMSFWPFSQCVQALRRTAPPAQVAAMDTSPQDPSYSLQIRIPEFLNDQRFRVQMFEAVLGWVKEIKERREKNIPSPSLQEILVSLGATRRQIAYEMSTPHAGVFGLEGSWTNDVWRTIVSE